MSCGRSGSRIHITGASTAVTPAMVSTTGRQPPKSASAAMAGRKTRVPVAVEAVSRPSIRPRRATNQRLTTVAPSTMATAPEPKPAMTPQVATYCQACVMKLDRPVEIAISSRDSVTTLRTPRVCINEAAKGPVRP